LEMTAPNKFSIYRIREYAKALDLEAICIDAEGRAHLAKSSPARPSSFNAIAWTSANDALRIARWINRQGVNNQHPSIEAAATACHVALINHDELVRGATEAAAAIDQALLAAQRDGALTGAFAQQREHAKGHRLPSYRRTIAGVRMLLFQATARSEPLPSIPDVVSTVLAQSAE
jgi:hypothetical protein